MVVREEHERVRTLIADTVTLLCRNGLSYKSKFCINALIGITLDESEVFLVDIRETIKNAEAESSEAESEALDSPKTSSRKRKKHRKRHNDNESASEAGSALADNDNFDDNSSEPPSKRLGNVKQEEDDDDDSQDLVFVKDEPGDSSLYGGNSSQTYQQQHQQQHSDILGNLAQQGQLYATPASDTLPGPSWDPSSQAPPPFSQSLPLPGNQSASLPPGASQESPSQANLGPDIGHYVHLPDNHRTDEARATILRHRFIPPKGWRAPLTLFGQKNRRVPSFVFYDNGYNSLSYSVLEDGLYCAECVAFSQKRVVLVTKGLNNWSNAKKQVDAHLLTEGHRHCVAKALRFLQEYTQKSNLPGFKQNPDLLDYNKETDMQDYSQKTDLQDFNKETELG